MENNEQKPPLKDIVQEMEKSASPIDFHKWISKNRVELITEKTLNEPEEKFGLWRWARTPIIKKDAGGNFGAIPQGYDYYTDQQILDLYNLDLPKLKQIGEGSETGLVDAREARIMAKGKEHLQLPLKGKVFVFPETFHPDISREARIMTLWQYYEAECNKNKSLTEAYELLLAKDAELSALYDELVKKYQASIDGSESYWKKRCEAAELNIETYCEWQDNQDGEPHMEDSEVYQKWQSALKAWQQLKSSIGEETNKTENHE
jgi:hypothetical protein